MDEQRKMVRAETHLAGRAALKQASAETEPCLIRNLSPVGARVVFCTPVTAPEAFDLFLDSSDQTYRARTIWHGENEVGVVFREARENAPDVLVDPSPTDDP
ncbi:hypothetical protein ASF60_02225 [Methylobacterium sp. Leaf113]|uniref:hypothetical protein n=1 Tax=Methylobacterium sp. Leaf113 TaxID=1736259 RepID=UPI0006FA5EDD|nr:hypothetical protein [Methylobacterium sp. Leaf113]KQP95017.1 hypothetical protein ASF60_02225 [Methylobacterium sp. Leaf113]